MRGYNIDDYIGNRYNHLTLIKNINKINKNNSKLALFKCDCGNIRELVFTQVINGQAKTCGCRQGFLSTQRQKEKHKAALLKHNISDTIIGYFNTLDNAIQARKEAEEKYFKPILDKYNKKRYSLRLRFFTRLCVLPTD